ncbi:unnamed protein product [Malus baccata var. baccata]
MFSYTSSDGRWRKIQLCPKGNYDGKGTHISLYLELDGSEDLRDSKVFAEFSLHILAAGSVPRIKVLVGLVSFHWTLSNMQANVTVLGAAKALQSACLQFQCC